LEKLSEPDTVNKTERQDQGMNKRRKFTAEYKTEVVLKVLSGEEELGAIASRLQINPNQIRAWKAQFVEKAPTLFEDSKAAKEAAEREASLEEEKTAMLKTIGQLTLERDFLMKQAHARNKGVLLQRR
jgi:putative transposase